MPTDALAADNTILSVEQAVADVTAQIEKDEAPALTDAASTEGQNTEAEPAAEDAEGPETATDGENAETDESETEGNAPEQSAIEPPRFWDAEAKKRFGELPRDLQELVLAKETERDKATSKSMEEFALKRKAADGEASRIAQLNGVLDKLIPQAAEMFKDKWENVDWNAVVDQYGAEQSLKLKNQMEGERKQLQQLQAAKVEADAATTSRFVTERFEKLKTVCPDLADDKAGPDRQLKLVQFIQAQTNAPVDQIIKRVSAEELSLAYDAMRWRQAQADAKAKSSAPKPQAKPATQARPSVKPTAAPARAGSPEAAKLKTLEGRFNENPSVQNLEALLKAQGS